jgi:hypothetical protein
MNKFNKNNSNCMEVTILAGSLRHHESNRHSPRLSRSLIFLTDCQIHNGHLHTCHDAPPCIPPLCKAIARTSPHTNAPISPQTSSKQEHQTRHIQHDQTPQLAGNVTMNGHPLTSGQNHSKCSVGKHYPTRRLGTH